MSPATSCGSRSLSRNRHHRRGGSTPRQGGYDHLQVLLEEKALLERQVEEYRETLENQAQLISTL